MIQIGTSTINTIRIGTGDVDHIDVGSIRVFPDAQPSVYITLNPTSVSAWNGYERTGTIAVSSNTNNWQVVASSSPSGNFFTAVKTNNTTVTWHMDANSGTTSRTGYVTVSYGNVSAQTVVYQNPGYYIYIEGGNNPRVVSSGGTTNLAFSVISRNGNTAVPVASSVTETWLRCTSTIDAGGGRYVYTFEVDRNTTTTRHATITFTQTLGTAGDVKSTSIMVTQQEMYVPTQISGFTMYANDGEWMLGRFKISEQSMGQYGTQPIYAIAVLRATVPPYDYSVEYDFTSYWGVPGPTQQVHLSNTVYKTVADTNTVTIPNGGTGYGWVITSYPNFQPPTVTTFKVTRT